MYEVDARGLSCPEPVLMTAEAMKSENGPIKVLVDDACARGNVEKHAKNHGKKVTVNDLGGEYELIIE